MTRKEFNRKYKAYIEEGFYGLAIDNEEVIDFLDREFPYIINNSMQPFRFSQIKTKFNYSRVYCNADSKTIRYLESEIDKILRT